jgi:hypothetical protein
VQSRERLEIRQKIADDFTNRLVAECELSGVTWSLRRDDMKAVMRQMTKLPKAVKGLVDSTTWNESFMHQNSRPSLACCSQRVAGTRAAVKLGLGHGRKGYVYPMKQHFCPF